MSKVYIASSWRNPDVRWLATKIRAAGHEVFDFTDPEHRPAGMDAFVYNASDVMGKPRREIDWLEFLTCEETARAFRSDKAGIDWCDTLVLLLPCGRSAHLEAGYAVGTGKRVIIYGDLPPGEFDVMYLFAHERIRWDDLPVLLAVLALQSRIPGEAYRTCKYSDGDSCEDYKEREEKGEGK